MSYGIKHLVTCRCILPQFKGHNDPPFHQFTVFSVVDNEGKVSVKFAQCNNCGIVHKVTDICRSTVIQNKESMGSILSINDIKSGLPYKLVEILENNDADLPTWESAKFIYDNKKWGNFVLLTTDVSEGVRQGKYVKILSDNIFQVEGFTCDEVIT